jgi:hypothetical protein
MYPLTAGATAMTLLLICGAAAEFHPVPAQAGSTSPQQFCARAGNDDQLRKPPASLTPAIKRLFGISGQYARNSTYYRCAGGQVALCYVGANLPCGKADQRRTLPPADLWCRDNPDAEVIPMVVTGHDTLYEWHCVGRQAKPAGEIGKLDSRGFFSANWKVLK